VDTELHPFYAIGRYSGSLRSEGGATAMSTDEGIAGQTDEKGHLAGSSPGGAGTGSGARQRQGLIEGEHRLVEKGRERLDERRELARGQARRLVDEEHRVADRVKTSGPGIVWSRLNAIDFMNSSMQFAALAVLCLFPFLIIVAAETGGDARPALIRRLGLDRNASDDVNALMSPGPHAVATLSILGAAFVLFGAVGVASTLQPWYHRVYDQAPHSRWVRQLAAQLLWLAGAVI
jgi:hypothetical protein